MADYPPITIGIAQPAAEFMDGSAIVHATQHLSPVVKVAGYVQVSPEMLTAWQPEQLHDHVRTQLDRTFHPWNYPDRAIVIHFEPFPRWARLIARVRR